MQNQDNIHDLIAELAMLTDLPNGPAGILNRLKTWCLEIGDKVVIRSGNALDVSNNLTRTKYSIDYARGAINLSLLFHKMSKKWYIDRLEPSL